MINNKKSVAEHKGSHSSIKKFLCSKCKKDFRFKYFTCFSYGEIINSTIAAYSKTFLPFMKTCSGCIQKTVFI